MEDEYDIGGVEKWLPVGDVNLGGNLTSVRTCWILNLAIALCLGVYSRKLAIT